MTLRFNNPMGAVWLLALCLLWACKGRQREVVADTTITQETSFNQVFLDSSAIAAFVAAHPSFEKYEQQFHDFYKVRNYQYAWFDSAGLAEQAHNFINLLHAAGESADSLAHDPGIDQVYARLTADSARFSGFTQEVINAELMFTGSFFNYASQKFGLSEIDATELGWYIPRKKLDLTSLLNEMLQNNGTLDSSYAPLNEQFYQLQDQLAAYKQLAVNFPADTVSYPAKPWKLGDRSLMLTRVKQRLYALGDLPEADSTPEFDISLDIAVRAFQKRHGLLVDGAIGKNMIRELNLSPETRIRQIIINMERARWMPAATDSHYLYVNIPEFMLHVYENGQHLFDMPVIVGKEGTSTVIFNGKLKYVVFAPYWNVPPSIVKNEILPKMKRNPRYLESQNMEVVKSGAVPVIRQKPGPGNALGQIKFLFPNNFNIYLHDTPDKTLFNRSNRSFSHGCIRLSDPVKLAEFLLRDQPEYDYFRITELMGGLQEKWVTLKKPVPVFITYFTAWVDREGKINFRSDIYGHDQKMADKLFLHTSL